MSKAHCEASSDGIALSGAIVFDTVTDLYAKGCSLLSARELDCVIRFKEVDQVDSAALTLMLSWLRFSASRGITVRFSDVPSGLRRIAELGGVASLLQLG